MIDTYPSTTDTYRVSLRVPVPCSRLRTYSAVRSLARRSYIGRWEWRAARSSGCHAPERARCCTI